MGISTAAREDISLRSLAVDVGLIADGTLRLNGGNQTELQMAQQASITEACENVFISYHLIRERVEHGEIVLEYLRSVENLAEIRTKGFDGQPHNKLAIMMGVALATGGGGAGLECCKFIYIHYKRTYSLVIGTN